MKLKVTFPSGRTTTYYRNIEGLMKSLDSAGIRYELVSNESTSQPSNR